MWLAKQNNVFIHVVLLRLIAALYKIGSESRLLMIRRLANVNIVGEQIASHDIDGE